jgi:hypothetical protein
LRRLVAASHPADVAAGLNESQANAICEILRALPAPSRAALFGYLPTRPDASGVVLYFALATALLGLPVSE